MSDISYEELAQRVAVVNQHRAEHLERAKQLFARIQALYITLAPLYAEAQVFAKECDTQGTDGNVEELVRQRHLKRLETITRDYRELLEGIAKEEPEDPRQNRRVNPTPIPERRHSGYMMRLGGFRKPEWQRRFFVVCDGQIMRYNTDIDYRHNAKCRGAVPLQIVTMVGPVQAPVDPVGHPFSFAVKLRASDGGADVIEYFSCADDSQRTEWMLAVSPPNGVTSVIATGIEEGADWAKRRFMSPFSKQS